MKRLGIAVRIAFYFAIGVALLYSPWIPLWSHNFFVIHYGWVASISQNNFLRGAISGIGVTDIWMAFEEVRRMGSSTGDGGPAR